LRNKLTCEIVAVETSPERLNKFELSRLNPILLIKKV